MLGGAADKKSCADGQMLRYIYSSLRYPAKAREDGVQGMVVAQFVIDKRGYVEDAKIVRDIGAGCGDASLDIIESMNRLDGPPFVPGKVGGKPVKVLYTMPIKFRLER